MSKLNQEKRPNQNEKVREKIKVKRDRLGKKSNAKYRSNEPSKLPADDGGQNFQNN